MLISRHQNADQNHDIKIVTDVLKIKGLLEAVFSVGSAPLASEDPRPAEGSSIE
jgi:hypothetical protein